MLDLRTAPLPDGEGPRAATRAWAASGIAGALAGFDPVLVASLASDLQAGPDGDLDVVCDLRRPGFLDAVAAAYGTRPGFATWHSGDRLMASFALGVPERCLTPSMRVELAAQARPVEEQRAYRHAVAHRRLVLAGGPAFAAEVRARRRRDGLKTEPALAAVLGLPGDPHEAVEALATAPDARLAALVAARDPA